MKLVLALALTHVVICMVCLSTINSGCQAEHVRPPGYTSSECVDDFIGDGRCDSGNNNAACDYDGGDCCECTCSEAAYYDCGEYADYDCQDPSANCGGFDHTAVHPSAFIARALSPMTEDPATQDTCSPNPCQNGGTCTMDTSGCHVCSCPMGYGGMQCQTDTTGLSKFSIDINFVGTWTDARRAVFQIAASRWSEVITHTPCGNGSLALTANLTYIDGPSGILGAAGPDSVWSTCTTISGAGSMLFDVDDIVALEEDGTFELVVLHEMGHTIGLGTLWAPPFSLCSLCDLIGTSTWACSAATTVYNELLGNPGGSDADIIELDGGGGTRCGHFDEDTFVDELMTGYLDDVMYLSKVTLGALDDIKYVVDATKADDYSLPDSNSSTAVNGANILLSKRKLDQIVHETEVRLVSDEGGIVGTLPGISVGF